MTVGVDEDLEVPAESPILDDLRKTFLQLGAPLAWLSIILDVVKKYHSEVLEDLRSILCTPRSCTQKYIGVLSFSTGIGFSSSVEK
ncbi:hypothetical protein P879_10477 [Paragonimus westermani]|uniref:Uncharacterized protein n=1 Tax=Paragonimus westermani TaxID=34504 RepID=A0A8T0DEY2_9TREM|nr:hypothetical protein P879_10477 [Paragonimus westermani]